VQEGREVRHLRVGQVELRHPAIGPADPEKRTQLLSALVFLNHRRSREIRPARSAAGVGAMAEAALFNEERFPAFDRRLIGHRRQRLLLSVGP
jgi:hypothetical protein